MIELVRKIKSTSNGKTISVAESCTGGMLSSYLTSIPGSSTYFTAGIVSYSNEAKVKLLSVSLESFLIKLLEYNLLKKIQDNIP